MTTQPRVFVAGSINIDISVRAQFALGIVVTLGALGAMACLQGQVLYVPGRVTLS